MTITRIDEIHNSFSDVFYTVKGVQLLDTFPRGKNSLTEATESESESVVLLQSSNIFSVLTNVKIKT